MQNQKSNPNFGSQLQKMDMIYALFNQHLFQEAKNNIELIEYFYRTDPDTSGNLAIEKFLGAIRNYQLSSIDEPLIKGICLELGWTDKESNEVLGKIVGWKQFKKDQIEPYRQTLRKIISQAILNQGKNQFGEDPAACLEFLKRAELKFDDSEIMSTISFEELDPNSLSQDVDETLRTGIEFLDSSYCSDVNSPFYGVPSGQAILISCPPGTGKTMFMMNIALNLASNGVRNHYLAMGDMNQRDFVDRMGSILTGNPMEITKTNRLQAHKLVSLAVGDNLDLALVPSAKVNVDEYVDLIKNSDYKAVFIDYDSNFKSNAAENMYLEYGKIYDKLTELTKMGILVFIAAQPHKNAWQADVIGQDMVGESARKIHSVDVALTGSNPTPFGNMGIFKIAKNRRGKVGREVGYIRLNNGRFKFVDKGLFMNLRNTDTTEWSESDVDSAIYSYRSMNANLGTTPSMSGGSIKGTQYKQSPMKNPFDKN